ncbi:MAG: alpha-L-rhamnosidase C-terminal domain-containing protein, partial [Nitrososphaerota archaeon]
REGATTLWERWELLTGGGMNSHNHAMFGGIDSWFYKVLAGINPSAEEPGFKKIVIKPHIIEELKHVSASTYTQRGLISSAWHIVGGRLALEVSIPVNSTGIVWLPVREASRPVITEGGRVIWREENPVPGVEGVKSVWREGDHVVVEVGSGNYSFQISTNASED